MLMAFILLGTAIVTVVAAMTYLVPPLARATRIAQRAASWRRTTGRIVDFAQEQPGDGRLEPVARPIVELRESNGVTYRVTPADPPLVNAFVTGSEWPILINPEDAHEASFAEQRHVWRGAGLPWLVFTMGLLLASGLAIAWALGQFLGLIQFGLEPVTEVMIAVGVIALAAVGAVMVGSLSEIHVRSRDDIPRDRVSFMPATPLGMMRARRAHPDGSRSPRQSSYTVVTYVLPDGRRVVGQPVHQSDGSGSCKNEVIRVALDRQDPTHFSLDVDSRSEATPASHR